MRLLRPSLHLKPISPRSPSNSIHIPFVKHLSTTLYQPPTLPASPTNNNTPTSHLLLLNPRTPHLSRSDLLSLLPSHFPRPPRAQGPVRPAFHTVFSTCLHRDPTTLSILGPPYIHSLVFPSRDAAKTFVERAGENWKSRWGGSWRWVQQGGGDDDGVLRGNSVLKGEGGGEGDFGMMEMRSIRAFAGVEGSRWKVRFMTRKEGDGGSGVGGGWVKIDISTGRGGYSGWDEWLVEVLALRGFEVEEVESLRLVRGGRFGIDGSWVMRVVGVGEMERLVRECRSWVGLMRFGERVGVRAENLFY